MGSIRTVTNAEQAYDDVYTIACAPFLDNGTQIIPILTKEVRRTSKDVPTEYVYLDQSHHGINKHTLQPGIYSAKVDFLCEINVAHDNMAEGRRMSLALQQAFHSKATNYGFVVGLVLATDAVTESGHKYIVSVELNYTTKMV